MAEMIDVSADNNLSPADCLISVNNILDFSEVNADESASIWPTTAGGSGCLIVSL